MQDCVLCNYYNKFLFPHMFFIPFSFPLEEFIYNYLITLSFYIIPKKGV